MSKTILITAFLFCSYTGFSQLKGQPLVDSLENAVLTMKEDSNKVKTYSRISQLYYGINPMKCFAPAEKALKISETIRWKKGIANMHNNLGLYISDTGNYELGNAHYRKSYVLNKELDSKLNQINNLNNIGRNYMAVSDFTGAAEYLFQALSIAEDIKSDDHIALVGTNLISCFSRQKNYPKATQYAEMTINHATLANNSQHLINGLMQLGAIHLEGKDTAGARSKLQEALKICEETVNYSDMAKVLINLALAMYPDYHTAIALLERVDSIIAEIGPGSAVDMNNSFTMADAYHQLSLQATGARKAAYQKKAANRMQKARTIADNTVPEMIAAILHLEGELSEEQGNYKAALLSFKRSTTISDSLYSQEKKNEIAGLEGKHNIDLKDREIAINKLLLASQRKTQMGLVGGVVLLMVIGLLLYWQSRARKRTNTTLMVLNNQLDEANKVKARFFGILSHDLRSPIVNLVHFLELQKDSPGLLSEADKQEHRKEIGESAENLLNTMEAMLLWSKEQMENFKPNIQAVAAEDLFTYLGNFFGQPENITLKFQGDPGLVMMADENYLRTIMQNLTSNAIRALKATPNATIIWEAKKQAAGVILSITDNGPGIGSDEANKLFDSRTVSNDKTGFGLHLVRDLAQSIKYKISVQSERGKGTTFILTN